MNKIKAMMFYIRRLKTFVIISKEEKNPEIDEFNNNNKKKKQHTKHEEQCKLDKNDRIFDIDRYV